MTGSLNATELPPNEEDTHATILWGSGIPEFIEESSFVNAARSLESALHDADSHVSLDRIKDLRQTSLSHAPADAEAPSPMNVDLPFRPVSSLPSLACFGNVSRLDTDNHLVSEEVKTEEATLDAARQIFFSDLDNVCKLCSVPLSKKNLAAVFFLDGRAKEKVMSFQTEHGRHPSMDEIQAIVDTVTRSTVAGNVEQPVRLFQLDLLSRTLAYAQASLSSKDVPVTDLDAERQLGKRPRADTVHEAYSWLCTLKPVPDELTMSSRTTWHRERSELKDPGESKRDRVSLDNMSNKASVFGGNSSSSLLNLRSRV